MSEESEREAAAIVERFDSAVPDGPEAAESPHAPPPLPGAPSDVETTNDFGVESNFAGTLVVIPGGLAQSELNEVGALVLGRLVALRLAAWLVVHADRNRSGHAEFREVLEAIEETID